jgi:sulfur-oxidizing protein SoxY
VIGGGFAGATCAGAPRIKLADSQQVVALAEMSDGSFWSESADIIVTIAACVEDLH